LLFTPQLKNSIDFSQYITEAFEERAFSKKTLKQESYGKASRRALRPSVAGCLKKQKTVPSQEEKEKKKKQNGEALRRRLQ